jgi:hypothetical protein
VQAEFLSLREIYENYWAVIGYLYTCFVTSADFSDNSTQITGYNGVEIQARLLK